MGPHVSECSYFTRQVSFSQGSPTLTLALALGVANFDPSGVANLDPSGIANFDPSPHRELCITIADEGMNVGKGGNL